MRNLIIVILVIFLFPSVSFSLTIFNRSPAAIEYGFDLMETFDDITDWTGVKRVGQAHYGLMSTDYPKRINGDDTPLNMYDYWVSDDPGEDFICDHRSSGGKIWDPNSTGSGKSLCVDISNRANTGLGDGKNWGPARFGTAFGTSDGTTGDHTHGYTTMYVFFMVYLFDNQWPTAIDGNNVGSYNSNDLRLHGGSWKFITMGQGFKEPWIHWQGPDSGHSPEYDYAVSTYGWHPNVVHFKPHADYPVTWSRLELKYGDISDYLYNQTDPEAPCIDESVGVQSTGYSQENVTVSQWIGIEIKYALNTRGNSDGTEQLWWYSPDGTEHELTQSLSSLWLQSTCEYDNGDKMNMVIIGGNNSNTYKWGATMEPRYYIDDFIIHSSKIGPTYFTKKLGVTGSPLNGNSHFTLNGNSTITFK